MYGFFCFNYFENTKVLISLDRITRLLWHCKDHSELTKRIKYITDIDPILFEAENITNQL